MYNVISPTTFFNTLFQDSLQALEDLGTTISISVTQLLA